MLVHRGHAPSLPTASEGDGRGRGGTCHVMAAVAASSAKRSLRAELKQRLRALSAEERLRQSHLLTQKVREGCGELNSCKLGLGSRVCAGAPLPLACASSAGSVGSPELPRGLDCSTFVHSSRVILLWRGKTLLRALVDVENVEPRPHFPV